MEYFKARFEFSSVTKLDEDDEYAEIDKLYNTVEECKVETADTEVEIYDEDEDSSEIYEITYYSDEESDYMFNMENTILNTIKEEFKYISMTKLDDEEKKIMKIMHDLLTNIYILENLINGKKTKPNKLNKLMVDQIEVAELYQDRFFKIVKKHTRRDLRKDL